ncbi:MAG: hypothetical protein CMP76_08045 [Flavobacterium sp.]|uniref:hypothetical protein n=1 Tax=Flavobacterium sp. TaxID=239 RepID=UPI000C6B4BC6|nr:hypothetical protein [Flavobacterium sp.]MBF03232.1 hypothetical protein [Flavobacterium sp.]
MGIGKLKNNIRLAKDLPSDFYIAGSAQGSELIYKTNTYQTISLSIPGTTITNINEIVRNGNDLFLTCNFGVDNIIVSLINCQIKSNKLVYEAINYKALTGITFVHSMVFYEDYLYLSNRVTGQPVILGKINPYNLEEQTYFQLPSGTGYIGSTDTLKVYRGYIYTLISNGNSGAYLVKVDLSFNSVQIIYTTGTTAAKRINSPYPFYIYNDEIFIVWVNRSSGVYNKIGIDVLNLDGTELRNSGELTTTLDGTQRPHPHWMTIFNGKIVITSLYNKFICRIDCKTLDLEQCINVGMTVTDDNSMMPNGYIYLNGEANIYDPAYLPKLLKIKYDDFTDLTEEISTQKFFNGNGSVGSINYNYTGNIQPVSKTNYSRKYKTITGFIAQNGTNNPSLEILDNDFEQFNLSFTRNSLGNYKTSIPDNFYATLILCQNIIPTSLTLEDDVANIKIATGVDGTEAYIVTTKNGILSDDCFPYNYFELRVYEPDAFELFTDEFTDEFI